MVADALIYHPSVAHYLKFVATTGMSSYSHSPSPFLPQSTLLASRPPNPLLTNMSPSRPRQSPAHAAILLALPGVVHVPHEPGAIKHLAVRNHQEAIRHDAQADARGQVRRALPRRGGRVGCEVDGSRAEVYGDWETVGICVLYAV